MDLPVHHQILFKACAKACKELQLAEDDWRSPLIHLPRMARGSWINDMNQASCFFDMTGAPGGQTQFPEEMFHLLWKHDCAELLDDLATWKGKSFADKARAKLDPLDANMYDVGRYNELDHLDEPKQIEKNAKTRLEYKSKYGLTKDVHKGIYQHVDGHLEYAMISTKLDSRLRMENLTLLGRALHTIQDFYSHTNYVELLLWQMAERPGLLPDLLVQSFNSPPSFLDTPDTIRKRAVLRGINSPQWNPVDPIYFCYRNSPSETALTGGLFEPLDTIFSILAIYERQLRAYDKDSDNEDSIISLIFGLVDFPRKNLIKCFLEVARDFRSLIEAIGGFVRKKSLSILENNLLSQFPARENELRQAFTVVDKYDGAKCDRAARAGRLNYLRHVIELVQLKKFQPSYPDGPWQLPNHTLLQKDDDFDVSESTDRLRYNLACSLATETTMKVLCAYFGGLADYENVLTTYLVHPAQQEETLLSTKFAPRINELLMTDWQRVS